MDLKHNYERFNGSARWNEHNYERFNGSARWNEFPWKNCLLNHLEIFESNSKIESSAIAILRC